MSDSGSGSGRRGFVRDVMKRISASRGGDDDERETRVPEEIDEIERLRDALRFLGPENADLARRVERVLMESTSCCASATTGSASRSTTASARTRSWSTPCKTRSSRSTC